MADRRRCFDEHPDLDVRTTHEFEDYVEVVGLDRSIRHFVRLPLAAALAAVNDLPSLVFADELDRPHQAATPGQPITRSSVIDMH